jgi:DNA adenine methylase
MRPFFCRSGTKKTIAEKLIKMFPAHSKYVEPFVGGGAVYFKKPPSPEEVINDLDKDLIDGYRALKTLKERDFPAPLDTIPKLTKFMKKTPRTKTQKLIHEIVRLCNGFAGRPIEGDPTNKIYQDSDPINKLEKIDEYQERLKHTRILNKDYKDVIRKEDGKDTFFFLDPPYEESEDIYKHGVIDYEEMRDVLKGIKGKFLLTLNNSKQLRDVFKDFKLSTIRVPGSKTKKGIGMRGDRNELIVKNY